MSLAFSASSDTVHFYSEPVPMNWGIPKLSEIVEKRLKKSLESGDLFMFRNKKATYAKVLYFDHEGFCLTAKKLSLAGLRFNFDAARSRMTLAGMRDILNQVESVTKRGGRLKIAA